MPHGGGKGRYTMHSIEIIKRLNQDKQDKYEGKEVIEVKPDIQKKTESRRNFFKALYEKLESNQW
jgi:hypothetical protein